jgi:hypothetical protein
MFSRRSPIARVFDGCNAEQGEEKAKYNELGCANAELVVESG